MGNADYELAGNLSPPLQNILGPGTAREFVEQLNRGFFVTRALL
jgi:hypothetical protein